jgi:hypothetical protein
MKITRFEDLECWQEARKLAHMIVTLTNEITLKRVFRLVDQMTGAAISVMNNIVEGFDSQFEPAYQQAEKVRMMIDGFRRYLRSHARSQHAVLTGSTGSTG